MTIKKRFCINLSAMTVLSIAAAVVSATVICLSVFVSFYEKSLIQGAKVTAEQSVKQTTLTVNNYIDSMKQKLELAVGFARNSASAAEIDEKFAFLAQMHEDIYSVCIYDKDGNILNTSKNYGEIKNTGNSDLSFNETDFSNREQNLSIPHVQNTFYGDYPWVVTLEKRIDSPIYQDTLYLVIDFKFSEISKFIDNIGIGSHGYCYIADSDGNIIYHPMQQLLFLGVKAENTQKTASLIDGVYTESDTVYAIDTADNGTWRTVGVSFTDELTQQLNENIAKGIIIAVICGIVISLAVILIYYRAVNKPVKELIAAMKTFENDAENFEYNGPYTNVGEIKIISESFVHTAQRIRLLLEKIKKDEAVLRKTELDALTAQINPHFLYNTLDSIQWMCEQGKNEQAAEMVRALARLFRVSINGGREFVTVGAELQHAQNYILILSNRYRDRFTYKFETEDGLQDYVCNKLIIQPLIENAVYHGAASAVDTVNICVSVKTAADNKDDMLITVSDDGVGMTEEQCRSILTKKQKGGTGGIGLKNVNDRIKICFGSEYGITVESEQDVGTKVTVRIPKTTKEPLYEN